MARRPEVDEWFDAYENPMKPVVQRVRELRSRQHASGAGETSRVMKLGSVDGA